MKTTRACTLESQPSAPGRVRARDVLSALPLGKTSQQKTLQSRCRRHHHALKTRFPQRVPCRPFTQKQGRLDDVRAWEGVSLALPDMPERRPTDLRHFIYAEMNENSSFTPPSPTRSWTISYVSRAIMYSSSVGMISMRTSERIDDISRSPRFFAEFSF